MPVLGIMMRLLSSHRLVLMLEVIVIQQANCGAFWMSWAMEEYVNI